MKDCSITRRFRQGHFQTILPVKSGCLRAPHFLGVGDWLPWMYFYFGHVGSDPSLAVLGPPPRRFSGQYALCPGRRWSTALRGAGFLQPTVSMASRPSNVGPSSNDVERCPHAHGKTAQVPLGYVTKRGSCGQRSGSFHKMK